MAHSPQAQKRIRQNETNRLRNKAKVSALRTAMKAVRAAIEAGDKKQASTVVLQACKLVDKVAKCNIIHANKAARHKSQMMRAVGAMQ
jgi:small subunit ribosomal protein S20